MKPLVALLLVVSLLNSCEAEGPSAVTTVFKKKGDDLILNVDADVPEDFVRVEWKFNEKIIVIFTRDGKPTVNPGFTGRIEFPVKDFSVKLKNVQEADSGVYAARVTSFEGEKPLAEYKVTVQGPVSPVELTVDSVVPGGSDSCNLTVTCSTQHSHINSTFRCVNRTCSQDGGEQSELTTSGASLRVYLLNSVITCNHSNHFNWTKDFKMTEHLCAEYPAPDPKHDPGTDHFLVIIVTTIGILVIIVVLLVVVFYRRKRGNSDTRENMENTVYEVPQVQSLDQSPTDDASGLSPTSTYCLVGPHTGSLIPTETRGMTLPESLYAQVEKTPRSFDN